MYMYIYIHLYIYIYVYIRFVGFVLIKICLFYSMMKVGYSCVLHVIVYEVAWTHIVVEVEINLAVVSC